MDAAFTKRFLSDVKKLKKDLRVELEKAIEKILEHPHAGKPLKHSFKGCRSARVGKFRIIYMEEKGKMVFVAFEHRKKAYRK